ncbi:MAG: DUF2497 domain-containing protein [Alphaproteobacteria bacterium]|nr:DUF2497 domain-containing protein [Alphaproteobacteria bacterium]
MEQKEPSMEEILSSIRRILSHEEETTSQSEEDLRTSVSTSALETAKEDVMELTEQMRVGSNFEVESVPETQEESSLPDDMVLLSEEAVQASTDRLSRLIDSVSQEKKQAPVATVSNSNNLEDIVITLLRPYLKEWLDANLPTLVEKVVQKEVEKLAKKVKLS